MPSLHAGFAALVALVLIQYGRWQAGLGTVYVVLMCISLTYLGEHYVIDELAGIALAYGAWRVFAPKMSYSRYGIYAAMN
jgi:membrane-associated phospholipid phosphatase